MLAFGEWGIVVDVIGERPGNHHQPGPQAFAPPRVETLLGDSMPRWQRPWTPGSRSLRPLFFQFSRHSFPHGFGTHPCPGPGAVWEALIEHLGADPARCLAGVILDI